MIKVKNERVVFSVYENGKLKKQIDLKNRLTDLYLDYITYQMLPSMISNDIYSGSPYDNTDDNTDTIFYPFSTAYLKFDTTQTIADTDTTMSYDVYDYDTSSLRTTIKVGENNKAMVTNYAFDLSTIANDSLFAGAGFGRWDSLEANYLFSYIDLSGADIRKTTDTSFSITRYDEIQTNEILYSGTIAEYLPFKDNLVQNGKLESIITCFGENGTGYEIEYNLNNLENRNLLVGDNLNGKNLILSFTNDGEIMDTLSLGGEWHNTIITDEGNYIQNYHSSATGFTEYVRIYYHGSVLATIYSMEDHTIDTNLLYYQLPSDFGTITAIDSPNGIPQYIMTDYVAKLVFRRLSAGIIEVSGFDNFYIDDIENDYPQNDYPQNDYPHQPGKIKSVKFKYLLDDDTYIYTYINIEDLDITYNDTEFKMKLICERGNY